MHYAHGSVLTWALRSTPTSHLTFPPFSDVDDMCYHPSVVPVPKQHLLAVGFWACVIMAFASFAVAAEPKPDANPALSQAFQTLVKLELGQDLGIFNPIRQAVVASRTDEQVRADLEGRLIAVLEADATDLAKDYTCRQLVIVGSRRPSGLGRPADQSTYVVHGSVCPGGHRKSGGQEDAS